VFEGRFVPDDVHGGTGEDVGRTNEDRVTDSVGELLG